MSTAEICAFIYLAIGLLITYFEFKCIYNRQIKELEESGKEIESGMYSIVVTTHTIAWPLLVAFRYATMLSKLKSGELKLNETKESNKD
jgi:membrane protein CcdC involved in cytochrome C biogenesis